MVEHQLPKLAFAGSIPVSRSKTRTCRDISHGFFFFAEPSARDRICEKEKVQVRSTGKWSLEAHHTVQV